MFRGKWTMIVVALKLFREKAHTHSHTHTHTEAMIKVNKIELAVCGHRRQRLGGSKPAWANSSRDPISENPFPKRAGGGAQVVECLPSKCEASDF
jgi:hypothetical protein